MAPKKSAKKQVEKKDTAFGSGEDSTAADGMMMTISEKLKTQGRTKKAAGPASTGESSTQGTPAPTSVKMDSPASQIDKPTAPKKKGTATAIKRPSGPPKQPKKVSAVDAMSKSYLPLMLCTIYVLIIISTAREIREEQPRECDSRIFCPEPL